MARHFKNGLDYFSHDCTMKDDRKIKLLKAKYKVIGYGVYNLLLEDIYSNSFYLFIDEDYILMFASENGLEENDIKEMINFMADKQIFDKKLYEKYSILTSERVQKTYLLGCIRRKRITLITEYLLIDVDEFSKCSQLNSSDIVYVNINELNVNINESNDDIKKQIERKGKEIESKLNEIETKENESKEKEAVSVKPKIDFNEVMEHWNIFANKMDLPVIKSITEDRRKKITSRSLESEFDFMEILKQIHQSDFLLGKVNGFKVSFDWIFKSSKNYLKIIEGNYKNAEVGSSNGTGDKGFDIGKSSWITKPLRL